MEVERRLAEFGDNTISAKKGKGPFLRFLLQFHQRYFSLEKEHWPVPPGLPCNHNVKHAMVSDPEDAGIPLPLTASLC